MRRFKVSVTASLIVSSIALLLSLGGTAMAAIIISSNSQVGKNTIAGHAAITGVHPNLITGSIAATDLSSSYKSSVKVHCGGGLVAAGDICVESAIRDPSTYDSALATCASAGRQLPDEGELALALTSLPAPQNYEWTAGRSVNGGYDGAGSIAENSDHSLSFGWTSRNNPQYYRCVVSPSN